MAESIKKSGINKLRGFNELNHNNSVDKKYISHEDSYRGLCEPKWLSLARTSCDDQKIYPSKYEIRKEKSRKVCEVELKQTYEDNKSCELKKNKSFELKGNNSCELKEKLFRPAAQVAYESENKNPSSLYEALQYVSHSVLKSSLFHNDKNNILKRDIYPSKRSISHMDHHRLSCHHTAPHLKCYSQLNIKETQLDSPHSKTVSFERCQWIPSNYLESTRRRHSYTSIMPQPQLNHPPHLLDEALNNLRHDCIDGYKEKNIIDSSSLDYEIKKTSNTIKTYENKQNNSNRKKGRAFSETPGFFKRQQNIKKKVIPLNQISSDYLPHTVKPERAIITRKTFNRIQKEMNTQSSCITRSKNIKELSNSKSNQFNPNTKTKLNKTNPVIKNPHIKKQPSINKVKSIRQNILTRKKTNISRIPRLKNTNSNLSPIHTPQTSLDSIPFKSNIPEFISNSESIQNKKNLIEHPTNSNNKWSNDEIQKLLHAYKMTSIFETDYWNQIALLVNSNLKYSGKECAEKLIELQEEKLLAKMKKTKSIESPEIESIVIPLKGNTKSWKMNQYINTSMAKFTKPDLLKNCINGKKENYSNEKEIIHNSENTKWFKSKNNSTPLLNTAQIKKLNTIHTGLTPRDAPKTNRQESIRKSNDNHSLTRNSVEEATYDLLNVPKRSLEMHWLIERHKKKNAIIQKNKMKSGKLQNQNTSSQPLNYDSHEKLTNILKHNEAQQKKMTYKQNYEALAHEFDHVKTIDPYLQAEYEFYNDENISDELEDAHYLAT